MSKKKKDSYEETLAQIFDKVQASAKPGRKPSTMPSKSDLTTITQSLLNCPEHTVVSYDKRVKNADGSPLQVESQPAKRYRDSLKPMLRSMGFDKNEVDKVDDLMISKDQAAAIMDVAITAQKDYMETGRRLVFPINSLEESQSSFTSDIVPERTSMPNKFEVREDGTRASVPTGKVMTTLAHRAIKVTNRNLDWLKKHSDKK